MKNSSKLGKCRNMMYTQQLKHLPCQTIDNLKSIVQALGADKYALIVHDKDCDENGKPVEAHVHVMLHFNNARAISSIANSFSDNAQSVEKWDGREENGFAYLIHRTKNSLCKHQYQTNEVVANFDFADYIMQAEEKAVKSSNRNHTKLLLDAFKEGHISKEELERTLTGSEYGRLKNQIENINAVLLKQQSEAWRKEALAQGKVLQVLWLYGSAGTGKTSYAKEYAKNYYDSIYISGSSKDLFQSYQGQHVIILDDLRPGYINYSDLLRILDPRSLETVAYLPSRYSDKALAAELIIITSPYPPNIFYSQTVDKGLMFVDTFEQLDRRLGLVVFFDDDFIYATHYNDTKNEYVPEKTRKRKNQYSSTYRSANISQIQSSSQIDLNHDIFFDGK